MLAKFVAIKNVGRYRNSATSPNPQIARHTFIAGANGFGKSTICAILRSLHTGEVDHIIGRKTLGVADGQSVDLLFDSNLIKFDSRGWSEHKPIFAIFDEVFVGENVHAGAVVDTAQKRNLYRIIIGDAGVKLAERDVELARESRARTVEITSSITGLRPHLTGNITVDDFLALPALADVDEQIKAQQTKVDAMKQSDMLSKRARLDQFPVPRIPDGLSELLNRTLDDIAGDAEAQLSNHLDSIKMAAEGQNWIESGLQHAEEDCPFCGQSIKGLPLVAAYRAVFSQKYRNLRDIVAVMQTDVAQQLGEAALANQSTIAERNKAGYEFWQKYVDFDWQSTALPTEFKNAATEFCNAVLSLLQTKNRAPLERISLSAEDEVTLANYVSAVADLNKVNKNIEAANALIDAKTVKPDAAVQAEAERRLAFLHATRNRHLPAVVTLCNKHIQLVADKAEIDVFRADVRARLDAHTAGVVRPYQERINTLLGDFNAGFAINDTSHAFPGGVAASTYQIVINGNSVQIGSSRTPASEPSFKNTLSAGDRTTLALTFFFASLEADPALAEKIVVFDDPFTSQDSFRRSQTVHSIMKVARACKQVIVLSHDATFLKQLWDKSPTDQRASLTIADHRDDGSKLLPVDLEKACQGRTASDIDDLQSYVSTGTGRLLDIVRKMRVVLEAHCRATYANSFDERDWLGDMVRKIREGGASHPAAAIHDELDQINEYSKQYHHGENTQDVTPDQIDSTELTGFARRTLKVVNASQA